MIPIFCINLERATERKELISKKWIDELGLDITFWKAYDRRNIDNNEFIYLYNKELAIQTIGRQLSNGEIACATSFCLLYEYLLENTYEEVIIMEDDITPSISNKTELFDRITDGKIEFPEAELILLHEYYRNHGKTKITKKHFSLCYGPPWGNQLFYANRKAIITLYELLRGMKFPADYPQRLLSAEERVIISNQPMCYHEWRGPNAITYIGNEYRGTHRKFIE